MQSGGVMRRPGSALLLSQSSQGSVCSARPAVAAAAAAGARPGVPRSRAPLTLSAANTLPASTAAAGDSGSLGPCCITIERVNGAGRLVEMQKLPGARIAVGRDESGSICFAVLAPKIEPRAFSIRGGVALHGKFLASGRATIRLIGQQCNLLVSRADPAAARRFMDGLAKKLKKDQEEARAKGVLAEQNAQARLLPAARLRAPPLEFNPVSPNLSDQENSPGSRKRRHDDGGGDDDDEPMANLTPGKRLRLLAELTREQTAVFDAVLRGQNVFFTGGAGTGKSLLLHRIIKALPSRGTYVTASTGVAACQIGGTTINNFAGFSDASTPKGPRSTASWLEARVLIIDEISMVASDFFDKLDKVGRAVRRCDRPFGGIQVVGCGDFFQLPPVTKDSDEKKYCFEAACWNTVFPNCHELTQVHRQRDNNFVDILNRVRRGEITSADLYKLQDTAKNQLSRDGLVATKLCTHVKDAESINQRELAKLEGETRVCVAQDQPNIESVTRMLDRSCRASRKLELKVGAQVMLLKNMDVKAGLVNGARGVVRRFTKLGHPEIDFVDAGRVVVHPETFEVRGGGGQVMGVRRQLPLQLAWAISIHKSQGMTLDAVEVNLARAFEYGQAYVALSRARSLDGLRVLGISAKCVRAHRRVQAFYAGLRTHVLSQSATSSAGF